MKIKLKIGEEADSTKDQKDLCHKFSLRVKTNNRFRKDQCHKVFLSVKLNIHKVADSNKDQERPMPQILTQSQTKQWDPEKPMPQKILQVKLKIG